MTYGEATRAIRDHLAATFGRELGRQAAGTAESTDALADRLLADAIRQRASDVHLDPQQAGATRVRFRIDGDLIDVALLTREQGGRLLRHFKAVCGLDSADHVRPGDARMTQAVDGREVDLRVASLPSVAGEKLSIRLLDRRRVLQHLDDLGFADDDRAAVAQWLADIGGTLLVAGPTGSGKTTTLYAILHELRLRDRCVVTIEDPVEYQVDGIVQTQVDRRHDLTFAAGLRAMLRADPDYLLVGEIRDPEAARAAVEASGSGRVLMSTIHAPDAVGSVAALRNFGLADHQIAGALRMVIAQRLVRRLCRRCRRRERVSEADRRWLESVGLPVTTEDAWAAVGCDECRHLGYDGRTGLFEVWRLSDADHEAILRHEHPHSLRGAASSPGVRDLLRDGWDKVERGVTTVAELRRAGSTVYPG